MVVLAPAPQGAVVEYGERGEAAGHGVAHAAQNGVGGEALVADAGVAVAELAVVVGAPHSEGAVGIDGQDVFPSG